MPRRYRPAIAPSASSAADACSTRAIRATHSGAARRAQSAAKIAAAVPSGMGDLPAGTYVVVSVADTGAGMDETTRLQAFEPFFTTKEFGKGSGLGLSQVYGFVRAAGGAAAIVSAPGEGATIELWLPCAAAGAVTGTRLPPNAPASALRRAEDGETVLAVEDEPAVLAGAARQHLRAREVERQVAARPSARAVDAGGKGCARAGQHGISLQRQQPAIALAINGA